MEILKAKWYDSCIYFERLSPINKLEATYSYILTKLFSIANPVKKSIKKTDCLVHIHLNTQALKILLKDKYIKEYNLFKFYIDSINEGAVWADQDFKSANHFYNPIKERGLFGRTNAMELTKEYHEKALSLWKEGNYKKSMFYLGAVIHLIQDMTVPQHANIRLLDNHHKYEQYVISKYKNIEEFKADKGSYILNSMEGYIKFNSRLALAIDKEFKNIDDKTERFYRTTKYALPLAMRTTAGALILFYKETNNLSHI